MSLSRKQLAQTAITAAMRARKKANVDLHALINVFDFAERYGVSVFFQDIPSMEGVYQADAKPRPAIVVSALRPAGRKAMTCGHELGHHVFNHGTQWDELVDSRSQARRFDPDEFLVDVFSAFLQMPKLAVSHELAKRSIDVASCLPEEVYALSTLFGVSYGGLVTHLEKSLGLIDMKRASDLSKFAPKHLREMILGGPCPQNLVIVDRYWQDKAVDVEVGDYVVLPTKVAIEGNSTSVEEQAASRTLVTGVAPGISRAADGEGWSTYIRVARKDYVGRAPYRFDEEVDDDC
jgi:hypothetical protein